MFLSWNKNIRNLKKKIRKGVPMIKCWSECWPTCLWVYQTTQTCVFHRPCWPTFIKKLINVGQHFLRIFFFTNMFVTIANRANMLANIVCEGCCSKCWPTCRPLSGRLKFSKDIISGNKLF